MTAGSPKAPPLQTLPQKIPLHERSDKLNPYHFNAWKHKLQQWMGKSRCSCEISTPAGLASHLARSWLVLAVDQLKYARLPSRRFRPRHKISDIEYPYWSHGNSIARCFNCHHGEELRYPEMRLAAAFWRLCCFAPEASKQGRSLTSLTSPCLTFCTGVWVETHGPLHTSCQGLDLNCFNILSPISIFLAGSPLCKTAGEEFETLGRRFQASQHGVTWQKTNIDALIIAPEY